MQHQPDLLAQYEQVLRKIHKKCAALCTRKEAR